MPEYLMTWKIDIEADTPQNAAEWALITQRDVQSIATVFTVRDKATGVEVDVDLNPEHSVEEVGDFTTSP